MPPEPAPKQRAEAVVIIKAIGDAPDALPACEIAVEKIATIIAERDAARAAHARLRGGG